MSFSETVSRTKINLFFSSNVMVLKCIIMASILTRRLPQIILTCSSSAVSRTFPHVYANFRQDLRYLNNNTSFKSPTKRALDRRPSNSTEDVAWSVIAYNLSENLKIENIDRLLDNLDGYKINQLPDDIQEEAVMLSLKIDHGSRDEEGNNSFDRALNDIFLFRTGSVVFWGVPYDKQRRILYGLASLKVNPNDSEQIQEEKEHILYTLTNSIDKSRLVRDCIQLSLNQSAQMLQLDQFAFSHSIALSVKLGIWEMMLDDYIKSVKWITDSMKNGEKLRLTKGQVFRKTGEILCLKHSINLSSDLLDLPDVYWDRSNQENMFLSLFSYLNIKKRTTVMNEKLNNCCELMNLLSSHMNDKHHIRLEWMIIILITVEVLFEVSKFL